MWLKIALGTLGFTLGVVLLAGVLFMLPGYTIEVMKCHERGVLVGMPSTYIFLEACYIGTEDGPVKWNVYRAQLEKDYEVRQEQ